MRPDVTKIGVVVPAHNEEELIESCLRSIRSAARHSPLPVELIVVADTCDDRTAEVALSYGSVIEVSHHNVGAARRAGFHALREPQRTWLTTTDADSVVPDDWFAWQLIYASAGVELLAGTVCVRDWSTYSHHVQNDYERRYRAARASTRIHGCNLGFLGSRYTSIGGFASLAVDEDRDLVRRFLAAEARVVWSDAFPVTTSARTTGRAPGGFAAYLRTLGALDGA